MSLAGIRRSFGKHAAAVMIFFGVATLVTSFAWNINGKINPISLHQQTAEDVVATVDGVAVTRRQYDRALHDPNSQFASVASNPMLQGFLRNQILDQLTQQAEYYAAAQRLGLKATPEQIAKYKDQILERSGIRTALGLASNASWDDVNNALQQKNQPPLDATYPEDELKEQVVLTQLVGTLKGDPVTDADARGSFKQYHVQHILVDNKKRSDTQAKQKAEDLLKKIKGGADFATLARQNSDDPGTASKGGDDGWIDVHTPYVPEFKTAAFALKPGEVSPEPIVSAAFGYFIIKSVAVRDTTPKDFDKQKADVIARLAQERQQQAMQNFAQSVQSAKHTIVIKDPELRGFKESSDADALPPGPGQTDAYNKAIADLQASLKNTSNPDAAAVQVRIAQIYQRLKQPDKAITAYEEALKSTDNAQLRMTLGDLYREQKNTDKALANYAAASDDAWDDQQVHQQLRTTYKQMGRTDLIAKEVAWLADYAKRHKPTASTFGSPLQLGGPAMGGGGVPVTPHAVPVSGGAPSASPKPTQ